MKVNSHVLFKCRLKPFKILEASQPVNCVPAFSKHHSLLSFHRCKHKNTSFCTHTHKYFPKVRNNSVRKALFYQRTGCSDKLNILRIIICTYQGSCHQASYSLSTEKAESPSSALTAFQTVLIQGIQVLARCFTNCERWRFILERKRRKLLQMRIFQVVPGCSSQDYFCIDLSIVLFLPLPFILMKL